MVAKTLICLAENMKSRDYESLVQAIFQQLHDQDAVQNVVVERDVVMRGTKTNHQIDVYWEFRKAGTSALARSSPPLLSKTDPEPVVHFA